MKKVFITLVLALVSFTTAFAATNAVKTTYFTPCSAYCVQKVGNRCNTGCEIIPDATGGFTVTCFYGECEPGPPGENPPDT